MSQGTPINKLGSGSMNQEDSRLVDSILNDLNTNEGQGQQNQQPQQISPDEHRAILEERQQQMMEQQMMQQQMMMQQQREVDNEPMSIMDKVQLEWKNILIVVVLSVIINTEMVNGLFKMKDMPYFIQEGGTLNMQAIIIKALIVGGLFFTIRTVIDKSI